MEVPKTSDCGNGQCWLRQNYTDLTSPKHVGMYQNRDSYFWRIILELFSYTVSGVTSKLWWVGAKSSCNFHNLFIPFFVLLTWCFFKGLVLLRDGLCPKICMPQQETNDLECFRNLNVFVSFFCPKKSQISFFLEEIRGELQLRFPRITFFHAFNTYIRG